MCDLELLYEASVSNLLPICHNWQHTLIKDFWLEKLRCTYRIPRNCGAYWMLPNLVRFVDWLLSQSRTCLITDLLNRSTLHLVGDRLYRHYIFKDATQELFGSIDLNQSSVKAQDRSLWRTLWKAYIQQWTFVGWYNDDWFLALQAIATAVTEERNETYDHIYYFIYSIDIYF